MQATVHVASRQLLPEVVLTAALAIVGIAAAVLTGFAMAWVLFAFMTWFAVAAVVRARRRGPVLSIGPDGLVEHRRDVSVRWDELESLRTVDRRGLRGAKPLLELVPKRPFHQPRGALLAAVLRGDIAVVDARDRSRIMIDLRHLRATPEEVMALIRSARGVPAPAPAAA